MKVRLTFTENILGTWPNEKDIADQFIVAKAPTDEFIAEELENIEGLNTEGTRGKTVFPRHDGVPVFYDYQIKGFFKDSCGMLSRLKTSGNESCKLKAYKKIIDGLIFVEPRHIPINFSGEIGSCMRPLRAQTAQGERISLANSEEIPAGSSIEFIINCFDAAHEKAVIEWLEYGKFRGIGQWRNSGKGRFLYEILDEEGNVIAGNK